MGRGIAAALIALICVVEADAARSANALVVGAVRIRGNHGVSARAIRRVMLTQARPWYAPWRSRSVFDERLLESDLERVRTLLRESGYYQAIVTHHVEIDGETAIVVLDVEEGPAAKVTEVEIVSADFVAGPEETLARRRTLALAVGDLLTQQAYDESRTKLERYYRERGYAYATAQKAAIVDVAAGSARVTYTMHRGAPAVFGTTRVEGAVTVAPRLIEREIAYRPGDAYDLRKVEATQANVFGLRLFRVVRVEPENLATATGVVDIVIRVTEGPPRELQAGVGYGLEDELRGQLRWQHNDFLGGGRQLGVRLKGSAITQAVEGEFRQPYFLAPKQTLVVPLTQAREDEPGFTLATIRLAPRLERKLAPFLTLSVGYDVEYDDLSGVSEDTIARLDGFRPRGYVSAVTAVLERNTTLELLDPKEGSVVRVSAEQAGGPWRGDYTFYRAVAEAKGYLPLPGSRTLAGRIGVGGGDGFGQSADLPLFRRFYAGGINSTRGYGRHLVGPLNDFGSPVGGRSLLDASVELRTPLYREFGAVVFLDVGEVRRKPFSLSLDDLQFGAGVGLRYATIVGPLRVDLGFPFEAPAGEPAWKVHFSIGQAF